MVYISYILRGAMPTKIQKWGNSLGVRIPKPLAEQLGLAEGSQVDLRVRGGELVVRLKKPREYSLPELLSRVTHENLHRETDTGPAVGREEW
jgi:antitoxin MazE